MYECLAKKASLTVHRLSKREAKNVARSIDVAYSNKFDRVLFDIPFKRLVGSERFLRKLYNLVILEEDSCQNFIEYSKWYKRFEKHYKGISHARVLVSGFSTALKFQRMGVDAQFVGKAYDEGVIENHGKERDIESAFVGRVKHSTYSGRAEMLADIAKRVDLKFPRSNPGAEYDDLLNRIRFFISADVGLGEYMIKNYEAMAAGCILIAYSQGKEDEFLGFKHLKNCVLYKAADDVKKGIDALRLDERLCERVQLGGMKLAKKHTYRKLSERVFSATAKPMETPKKCKWWY